MMEDLKDHIEKSFRRLSSEDYSAEHIWKGIDYDWPADWEGRALLAFVNLYEITGEKTACLETMPEALPKHLNAADYMGRAFERGRGGRAVFVGAQLDVARFDRIL